MPATSPRKAARSSGLARVGLATAAAFAAACALSSAETFAAGGASRAPARGGVALYAEAEAAPSPSPSPSVALVKVTEENKVTTASVIGGLAGLLVGGVWVGGALFAAGSYLARKDDDVSKALKGVASGSLEALNFGAYVNEKYAVTDKIGSALSEAVEGAKSKSDSKETATAATDFLSTVTKTLEDADKEIGFKETFGTLATSASDLAFQAVDKAVEVNDKYKLTDQLAEKIEEATKSAGSSSSSSSSSSASKP